MRPPIAAILLATILALPFPPHARAAQPDSKPAPTDSKPGQPKKAEPPKDTPPKPPADIKLKVGDKAPPLTPDVWVKGPEISTFEPTRVYVIEFWATWCPECRKALPILAKLAREQKDHLSIISVASSERKPKSAQDERLAGVKAFVAAHDDSMPQSVVFDGSRTMASNWLVAAGRVYIPCVFIVDPKGEITWIGDPRGKEFSDAVTKALKALPQPPTKPPESVAKPSQRKTKKGS